MKLSFQELEQAFEFVSSGTAGENSALLDKATGQIYWHSESCDLDEIPEDIWGSEDAVEIPHKNDLDLGQHLVFDFVNIHSPQLTPQVRKIFSQSGAYARYKRFLGAKGLLGKWYEFEQAEQEKALRDWALENGISFSSE